MATFDVAFEAWRFKKYGEQPYPVDAYTHFGIGWKAAMATAAEVAEAERLKTRNGGAINACKAIAQSLRELGR